MSRPKENTVEESEYLPGIGVDVGTANIVICRQKKDNSFEAKYHRNMLFEMDVSEEADSVLERGNYLYIKADNKYYIIGEDALTIVNAIGRGEIIRPMKEGLINPNLKKAQQLLNFILKTIVGSPIIENEPLRFSVPANPVDVPDKNNMFHDMMLNSFFTGLGFSAKAINEGRACLFNESPVMTTESGEKIPLTGWGISCGGGMVNSSIAVRGLPITEFSITKSGDYIDKQVQMVTNEQLAKIIKTKEKKLDLSNVDMGDNIQPALSVYYDEFMTRVIKTAFDELRKNKHEFEGPMPVVICGGTSMAKGFIDRFNSHVKKAELPFDISSVTLSAAPFYAVSQGACLSARSDYNKLMKG
jgi:actin-like ATPase involved in cell morphogenesis